MILDGGMVRMSELEGTVRRLGANWSLLQSGLFGGSPERFLEVKREVDEQLSDSKTAISERIVVLCALD